MNNYKDPQVAVSFIFSIFTPTSLGKMKPFWLAHIFQMGGSKNHPLVLDVSGFQDVNFWDVD